MASVRDGFFIILHGLKLFRLRTLNTVIEDIPCSAANINKVFSRPSRSFRTDFKIASSTSGVTTGGRPDLEASST